MVRQHYKKWSSLKCVTELRLNFIATQLDKWILNGNLHRENAETIPVFPRSNEFENVQLISRKGLLSDLWSLIYQERCALTLSIKGTFILQDPEKSNFWEDFPDHIRLQWFLSLLNTSVTLWITLLSGIYMLLYFVPCVRSHLINRIVSSSRAEIRP